MCETSSHLLGEVIFLTSSSRGIWLPVVMYQSPCQPPSSLNHTLKYLLYILKSTPASQGFLPPRYPFVLFIMTKFSPFLLLSFFLTLTIGHLLPFFLHSGLFQMPMDIFPFLPTIKTFTNNGRVLLAISFWTPLYTSGAENLTYICH